MDSQKIMMYTNVNSNLANLVTMKKIWNAKNATGLEVQRPVSMMVVLMIILPMNKLQNVIKNQNL